jgi:CubicO group peptidase (beta-lactamase class C family)
MHINAYDMARFGYLFLRNGKWKDQTLVSEQWIKQARTPGVANAEYGYANWYLNTGRKPMPATPESSVRFSGDGPNIIYIDWENDLVVVVRWMRNDALNEFLGKVIGALRPRPTA